MEIRGVVSAKRVFADLVVTVLLVAYLAGGTAKTLPVSSYPYQLQDGDLGKKSDVSRGQISDELQHSGSPAEGGVGSDIKIAVELFENDNATVQVKRGSEFKIVCVSPGETQESDRTKWMKDGKELKPAEFTRYVFTRIALTLKVVRRIDKGHYECVVYNPAGEVRFHRTVKLVFGNKTAPEHTTPEYDVDEEELADKGLACPPSQVTPVRTYHEEVPSEDEGDDEFSNIIDDAENGTMVVGTNVEAPYLCFDVNDKKKKMTHYLVRPAGTTATLYCNPRGSPKPSVKWFKGTLPFKATGYQHTITRNSIILADVSQSDGAKYTCQITNGHQTLSYEIRFIVTLVSHAPPIFTESPDNVTLIVGETLRLSVKVLSSAEYFLNWIKEDLSNPSKRIPVQSRIYSHPVNVNKMDNHYLILENMTFEDAGWYRCIAVNSIGKEEKSIYVDVLEDVLTPYHPDNSATIAYVMIPTVFGFLIVFFALCCYLNRVVHKRRLDKMKLKHTQIEETKVVILTPRSIPEIEGGTINVPEVNIKTVRSRHFDGQEYELPIDPTWEFPRDRLQLGTYLGEGAFGEVRMGMADGIAEKGVTSCVAVKSLKKVHTDDELIDLMSEMETMKVLGKHVNIINLLGCCTRSGELLVVMEYAENGNLRDYLRNNQHNFPYLIPKPANNNNNNNDGNPVGPLDGTDCLEFRDLMSFAYQVARGMDYLSQRKYVHRDLAARNVLVTRDKIVKIADFGMTRFANEYYRKKSDGRVPVKWMAPETLFYRMYTAHSDVWSYGILLYEIVTLGGSPYPSMPDVGKLLEFLKEGKRMSRPRECPQELYLIMLECWMEKPECRPSFSDLVEDIGRMLSIASNKQYFQMEGVDLPERIMTPPDSPENSATGIIFDPDFIKSISDI